MYPTRTFRLPSPRPLPGELDGLLRTFLRGIGPVSGAGRVPALNVSETDEALIVEAELPGLRLDELEVLVEGRELTLAAGLRSESMGADDAPSPAARYHRRERRKPVFRRTLRLPVDVEPDRAEAQLEHGVLTVTLPKQAAARPHRIEVKRR